MHQIDKLMNAYFTKATVICEIKVWQNYFTQEDEAEIIKAKVFGLQKSKMKNLGFKIE